MKDRISEILGSIGVSRVGEVSGYESMSVKSYLSCRPTAKHLVVDSGKGTSRDHAFMSSAVESIERYVAENLSEDLIRVCLDTDLDVFFKEQLRASGQWVRCLEGIELTKGRQVVVPIEACEYSVIDPTRLIARFPAGTTGLGAHTSSHRAIMSGLSEIIERDAIARCVRRDLTSTCLDTVNTMTTKTGIPAHSVRIFEYQTGWPLRIVGIEARHPNMEGAMVGFGVGHRKSQALEDACQEAMQTWLMRIAGSRDDWAYSPMEKLMLDGDESVRHDGAFDDRLSMEGRESENHDKYSEKRLQELLEYARKEKILVYACELRSEISTLPIRVYRVIVPGMYALRQGAMLTGYPVIP